MYELGFFIFLSVIFYLDYKLYLRGNDSIFFKDKSQLEKDLREIQELEAKNRLRELKKGR